MSKLNKYLNKNMNDIDWAEEVEKLVLEGINTELAIMKVQDLREGYINFSTKLGGTIQCENVTLKYLMMLHRKEADELYRAYIKKDDENFEEECWDVIQTVLNMMQFKNIDMKESLITHKRKLISRRRKFDKDIIKIL
ncbi:MAG: MazG nucleotide pyrophosphohydrolase domain-containing protein [Sarcina sp.]